MAIVFGLVAWFTELTGLPPEAFTFAVGAVVLILSFVAAFIAHRVEHSADTKRESAVVASISSILAGSSSTIWLETSPGGYVSLAIFVPMIAALILGYYGRPLIKNLFGIARKVGVDKVNSMLGDKKK